MPAISSLSDLVNRPISTNDVISSSDHEALRNDLEGRIANLNDVVSDLQSNFAGTSAPTDNAVEGGMWADTTNDPLDMKYDPDGSGADHIILTHIEKARVWPSFSAHRNASDQTSVGTAATKIKWTTEIFDTNSDFSHDADDSGGATESRFTPTVAGKYLLIAALFYSIASDGDGLKVFIYKNGSEVNAVLTRSGSASDGGVTISVIVDADGTADYFEVFGANVTGTDTVKGDLTDTFFMGSRIA